MSTLSEIKTNLLIRLEAVATEIAESADGDSNEYIMRRYDELDRMLASFKNLEVLEGDATEAAGSWEVITQGET